MISGSWRSNEIDLRQQATRSVRDIIDAPCSAPAAFGGLILPDPGKTKRQFQSRIEFLIRPAITTWVCVARRTPPENRFLDGFDRSTGHDPTVSAHR